LERTSPQLARRSHSRPNKGLDLNKSLRGHHRLGRQFVDVREPNPRVLAGDYTPHSAVNIFREGVGNRLRHGQSGEIPVRSPPAALQMFLMGAGWDMG
jgi:hypothetical protein